VQGNRYGLAPRQSPLLSVLPQNQKEKAFLNLCGRLACFVDKQEDNIYLIPYTSFI
jgi:hypothetical protein